MSQAGVCCIYYCFLGKRRSSSIRTSSSFVAIILFMGQDFVLDKSVQRDEMAMTDGYVPDKSV